MTDRLRSERETQNRVIRLFQSLGYDYLGNWEKRPKNSAVEFAQLEAFLRKNGANSAQISAVETTINRELAALHQSLYEANRRKARRHTFMPRLRYELNAPKVYLEDELTGSLTFQEQLTGNELASKQGTADGQTDGTSRLSARDGPLPARLSPPRRTR